jgi:hypothetical protein
MAQDRIYLVCRHCNESRAIFRIIAGGESPSQLQEPEPNFNPGLRDWMAKHIAHNPLCGDWLAEFGEPGQWFTLETETQKETTT